MSVKGSQIKTYTGHKKLLFGDELPPVPKGIRGFLISNPGAGKTLFLNWLAYLSALEGISVLVLDGETPPEQVRRNLNRYSLHYGKNWLDLPLTVRLSDEFEWNNLEKENIEGLDPNLVILESIQSLSGNTNDPNIGRLVKRTLNKIYAYRRWCLISAHTNQDSFYLTLGELQRLETPNLARIVKGDTAIVSQGCDAAYLLKQLTKEPLRIAIVIKGRRGYFVARTYYYELQEPDGKEDDTPMWWKPIPPIKQELNQYALEILKLVEEHIDGGGKPAPIKAREIMNEAVTLKSEERRGMMNLLIERGDIVAVAPFTYQAKNGKRPKKSGCQI